MCDRLGTAAINVSHMIELLGLMCIQYAHNLILRKPLRVSESEVGDRVLGLVLATLPRIRVVPQDLLAASTAGSACVFLCHRSDRSLTLCCARDHAFAFADSDDWSFIDKGVKEAPCRLVLRVRVLLHRHGAHSRLLLRGEDETLSHADL